MTGRGLSGLVVLLVFLAAGPLLAPYLPPGPGFLLSPACAAVAAASLVILYALFAWPLLGRNRDPATVAREGLAQLLVGLPFVAGLGWSYGILPQAMLTAGAAIVGAVVVTGIWLGGPGRTGSGDRVFAAFWVLVVAAAPLANYTMMDFAGARSSLGFRISPVLAVRRILLELPGADPTPFLLTGLVFLAGASAWGLTRKVSAAVVLLALSGLASGGAEVTPVFGPAYVPGRPLLLRVEGDGDVAVTVPGRGTYHGSAEGGRADVFVPGVVGMRDVRIGEESIPLALRAVSPGRWIVSLGPVPDDLRAAADRAGFAITRAAPGAEALPWQVYLALDGIVDPEGRLPGEYARTLASAGVPIVRTADDIPSPSPLRRPWEETGRVLSDEGLDRMFGPSSAPDPSRSRTTFIVLGLFGVTVVAVLRYVGRRGGGTLPALLAIGVAGAVATGACLTAIPRYRDAVVDRVVAAGPSTRLTVIRIRCRRATEARVACDGFPLLLGRPSEATVRTGAPGVVLTLPMRKGETRYVAVRDHLGASANAGFDFFLTPDGLAKPGETALPAGDFLERHFTGPGGRTTATGWLVRKLLRLDGSIGEKYGVRIADPRRLEVGRVAD